MVIVDAAAYDQARAARTGQQLVDALAASPLGEVAFDRESLESPVRPVEL